MISVDLQPPKIPVPLANPLCLEPLTNQSPFLLLKHGPGGGAGGNEMLANPTVHLDS